MPKKMGVNSKSEAAKSRKNAAEAEQKDRQSREKEEQYWREAEGPKSKAAKKREEEAEKKAESASKKAEAKRLAEQEEKELEKCLKVNRVSSPVPKVTEAELVRRREEEQAALAKKSEEAKKKQRRMAEEEEYEKMVLVSNTNRDDSLIEARTVDEALAKMTVADKLPVDRHPEKRLKASFKAYEEAEMARVKEEKPGLTHTQYKDLISKMWKKSPDNPLNQVY
ncbi:unnamed protein product [Eruca vesicaria subsp. sativa]|uniref:Coiled-coil domain-containing protein n=1 Tax=Eruca vesicaria subsp. sativa TaxID=29727 RepID=A0ABC8J0T2_ERUVS|nr:unnamed protein product [Eruca vesicaria subsp. sativa]